MCCHQYHQDEKMLQVECNRIFTDLYREAHIQALHSIQMAPHWPPTPLFATQHLNCV